jgi:hypothetical protein
VAENSSTSSLKSGEEAPLLTEIAPFALAYCLIPSLLSFLWTQGCNLLRPHICFVDIGLEFHVGLNLTCCHSVALQ